VLNGETVGARFGLSATSPSATGLLRWSNEDGATLELIERAPADWPHEVGAELAKLHGLTFPDDERLTLLDGWVNRTRIGGLPLAIHASSLALGMEPTTKDAWTTAIYSTANLPEWRAEIGLSFSQRRRRAQAYDIRVEWKLED
jgi:hypothetical protein